MADATAGPGQTCREHCDECDHCFSTENVRTTYCGKVYEEGIGDCRDDSPASWGYEADRGECSEMRRRCDIWREGINQGRTVRRPAGALDVDALAAELGL